MDLRADRQVERAGTGSRGMARAATLGRRPTETAGLPSLVAVATAPALLLLMLLARCPSAQGFKPVVLDIVECHPCDDDSRCVDQWSLCNGYADCEDGSDEAPSLCNLGTFNCSRSDRAPCPGAPEGHFRCMSPWQVCDGKEDCFEATEEAADYCAKFDCATAGKVSCPKPASGIDVTPQCVNNDNLCDGNPDCPGAADEDDDFCTNQHKCGDGFVKCRVDGAARCVPGIYCDGQASCPVDDNGVAADEDQEMCKAYECPDDSWKCGDGLQCIQKSLLCNTIPDCQDESDESESLCTESFDCAATGRVPCPSGGYCMDDYCTVCNGEKDFVPICPNGSDQFPENCGLRNDTDCFKGCNQNGKGNVVCYKGGPLAGSKEGGEGAGEGGDFGSKGGDVEDSPTDVLPIDNDVPSSPSEGTGVVGTTTRLGTKSKGKKAKTGNGKGTKVKKGRKGKKGKKGKRGKKGKKWKKGKKAEDKTGDVEGKVEEGARKGRRKGKRHSGKYKGKKGHGKQ